MCLEPMATVLTNPHSVSRMIYRPLFYHLLFIFQCNVMTFKVLDGLAPTYLVGLNCNHYSLSALWLSYKKIHKSALLPCMLWKNFSFYKFWPLSPVFFTLPAHQIIWSLLNLKFSSDHFTGMYYFLHSLTHWTFKETTKLAMFKCPLRNFPCKWQQPT